MVASIVSCAVPGNGKLFRHARPSTLNSAALTAATPGRSPKPIEHLEERRALLIRLQALYRFPGHEQHVRRREARVHARQPGERQHQQAADEQHDQAERDLHHDERTHVARAGGCPNAARPSGRSSAGRPTRAAPARARTTRCSAASARRRTRRAASRRGGRAARDPPPTRACPRLPAPRARRRATPRRHAAPATSALSTSICWIRRPRPAPSERRSDISCSRAAVRARNRFATFEPAMSSISAAIPARIHSGR